MIRNRAIRTACLSGLCTIIVGVIALTAFLTQGIRLVLSRSNAANIHKLSELEEDIWQIQWSRDGRQVAFVSWEKPVEIRDATTLKHLHQIGVGAKIIQFVFSPYSAVVAYNE